MPHSELVGHDSLIECHFCWVAGNTVWYHMAHEFRPSGVFCCRPDGLELAFRFFTWHFAFRRHF